MAQIPIEELTKIKNIKTGEISTIEEGSYDPSVYQKVDKPYFGWEEQSITSDDLTPTGGESFVEEETIVPPAVDYSAYERQPLEKTSSETEQQSLTEQLQALNIELTGEPAFRAEQEKIQGIEAIETTQEDLTSQLLDLQAQQKALQLQAETIPNIMQEQAMGRGITAAGLAPHTASALRKNQIQQSIIATEALTLSAAVDAINGKLGLANKKIERAVEAKFGPEKARLDALTANLKLVKDSPDATLEDKNRADAAQAQVDIQNAKIEAQKAEQAEIWKTYVDAAKANVDAITLEKIKNASTKEEALQIATEAKVFEEPEAIKAPTTKKFGDKWYQWNDVTGGWEDMGVAEDEGATIITDSGEAVNITNVDGVKYLADQGYSYADVYSYLDTETKLTTGAIKDLLKEAGLISPKEKENAFLDLRTTIDEYKALWKKRGDKNIHGTREQLITKIERNFPELTLEEIQTEIYKEVSDKWLEENKKKFLGIF